MLWLALAIIASLVWAVVAVIDKYLVAHELHDSILATVSSGLGTFLIFGIAALFKGTVVTDTNSMMLGMVAGASYTVAIGIYYWVMQREEVSRFMALLGTMPLFVLLLGFFFLGERFTALTYIGIALITVGAIIISLKKTRNHSWINPVIFFALLASLFFALRTVLVKIATEGASIWPILFWIGVGGGVVALVFLAIRHPHIRKKAKLGIKHTFIVGSFNAVGFFVFTGAIAIGPASIVAAITTGSEPIFTFLLALLLTRYYPTSLHEEMTPGALTQKIAAICLIVAGALLVI